MKSERSLASGRTVFAIVRVLIAWLSLFLVSAGAQSAGQNGVYNSSGGSVVNSSAFIDASVFAASGRDFCGVLNYILSPGHGYPAAGAVIDARGLLSSTPPTSMTCAASPWAGITGPPPATNHTQFFGPQSVDGNIGSATFAEVIHADPPRLLQLGAKFLF
jgi:hypothetical protein